MGIGAEFQGRCYISIADAADAYFTGQPVQIVSGATSYATEFSKLGAVWHSKGYSISSTGVWTTRYKSIAVVPIFPVCDTAESFNDGLLLGWGIATAMVLAWAVSHMRRALGIV
jgi:hypothetical protein